MTLDLSRPVQTRDGTPVKILAVNEEIAGGYSIVGNCQGHIETWMPDGRYDRSSDLRKNMDLVNVPCVSRDGDTWTLAQPSTPLLAESEIHIQLLDHDRIRLVAPTSTILDRHHATHLHQILGEVLQ